MKNRRTKKTKLKLLNGRELASYIKERQSYELRRLKQEQGKIPKLVIFYDNDNPVIRKYIDLKKAYGEDIGVEVVDMKLVPETAPAQLAEASEDQDTDAIIVQLPLKVVSEDILRSIPAAKDVDGLNGGFDSATAEAINWLVGGHNIDLKSKKIAIVGRGRLVGAPLIHMWQKSGLALKIFGRGDDLGQLKDYDFIVSATGVPGLIRSEFVMPGAVLIDAGTASEDGVIKGDAEAALYTRDDISITPKVGGVGPLTVSALFDHVIRAAL